MQSDSGASTGLDRILFIAGNANSLKRDGLE